MATAEGIVRRLGPIGPAIIERQSFLVVGTLGQVAARLNELHCMFASRDPDVFDVEAYRAMHDDLVRAFPDPARDRDGITQHWLTNGIGEWRNGSRTFSPWRYMQLYPELSLAGPQEAIDHYIRWGRKEGRSTIVKAEGGMQHTTVLSKGGGRAAGQNNNGQLGNGTTTLSPWPVGTIGSFHWMMEIAAGDYNSIAVKSDGTVWTWGSNQYGLRGNGTTGGYDSQPRIVPGSGNVVTPSSKDRSVVASGTGASAVVDNNGNVWTWGVNWNGRLGDGTTINRSTPVQVIKEGGTPLGGIVSVSVGTGHMLALDANETVWAWGAGAYGALGRGSTEDSYVARQVQHLVEKEIDGQKVLVPEPLGGISKVVCGGSNFSLALTRYGRLFGWGNNGSNQLGSGIHSTQSYVPYASILDLAPVDKVAAGSYHAIARCSSDGKVYSWGYNGYGQLGIGPYSGNRKQEEMHLQGPGEVMRGITDVAAGNYFSIMIRDSDDPAVFVVGDNQMGQLGLGDRTQRNTPVRSQF